MKKGFLFWINRFVGVLFVAGGITYIFTGAEDGTIWPASLPRASLAMRLALGGALALVGTLALFGINDEKKGSK